ncbi:MAG: hypothetical protein RIQ56_941 [Candidatus Parcubacteria bacterium]
MFCELRWRFAVLLAQEISVTRIEFFKDDSIGITFQLSKACLLTVIATVKVIADGRWWDTGTFIAPMFAREIADGPLVTIARALLKIHGRRTDIRVRRIGSVAVSRCRSFRVRIRSAWEEGCAVGIRTARRLCVH